MIAPSLLAGRSRYERAIEAWVDNTHDDAFTHTVAIRDDDHAVELSAVCTPSPGYEVRALHARIAGGSADPAVPEALRQLEGSRMVGGFTRRLAEAGGSRPGAGLFVDAGIEAARLARQVTKVPASATAKLGRDALAYWELDSTSWEDFAGSCFTYSDAGRALFGTRPVSTPMAAELYCPPAGARRVFVRRKLSRLVQVGQRLHLYHSMHDNVHGFDLHYELDLGSLVVVAAESVISRLPYDGICNEPQRRIGDMVGQPVDGLLRKRTQSLLGGIAGCSQLYDLTADLFKLVELPRAS